MTDILNTGKSALFAFQRALATTSHNIANVNTEGYARQRVDFSGRPGNTKVDHSAGAGVEVIDIQRMQDQFATTRVNSATSAYEEQKTHLHMAQRLDNLVASEGSSVAPAISDFFNSLQDANIDPTSVASREVVLDSAQQLANRFQTMQGQFDDIQTEVNQRTQAAVDSIDELAEAISEVNKQVIGTWASASSDSKNDLLDQRDRLVDELSQYVDIDTVIQGNGALNVYMGTGIGLVIDSVATPVSSELHDTYPDRLQVMIGKEGFKQNVSSRLTGGEIGGLSEFTTQTLHPAMQELGRLALSIADSLNSQHAEGFDIDGEVGTAIFGSAEPSVFSSAKNSGSGAISATITDTAALEASDYLIKFDGTNYTATKSSDGSKTTGSLPFELDGLSLSVSGTPDVGDSFVLSATGRAASSMTLQLTNSDKLALSGRLTTSSSISNLGDAVIGAANITDSSDTALNDSVDITFTSDSNYDIIDVASGITVSSGASYTSGEPITLNGWEVTIEGQAQAGDTHRIEPNYTGQGNNSNGLALNDLQDAMLLDGGKQTFNDSYGTLVSRVGAQTSSASNRSTALESLRDAAVDRQQSMQAVSLDEEAIDLTRYQQAYQASAQIIAAADEMFDTILGAVR